MTSKYLLVGGLLAAMTNQVLAIGDIQDNGNESSGVVTDAMVGTIIQGLSVELKDTLIFPDLVLSGTLGQTTYVEMAVDGTPSYSTNGNPLGEGGSIVGYTNVDGTNFRPGKITIIGHEGKAISVSIEKAGTITDIDQHGYEITPILAGSDASTNLAAGTSDDNNYESAQLNVFFGGRLTAETINGSNIGKVTQDLNVTVSYR